MSQKATILALAFALQDENDSVRENAARGLGHMKDQAAAATPALIAGLGDSSPDVARWCAWALGRIGTGAAAAAPALERCCSSKNLALAEQASEALERVKGQWVEGAWRV